MTVAARRAAVAQAQAVGVSQRRAGALAGLARQTARYRGHRTVPPGLVARLQRLAGERPRWGYRRLYVRLRREGFAIHRKRVYRLYREQGLAVRRRGRKRVAVPRQPIPVPTRPNERWSLDFVSDALADGRRFRVLTIVDDCTRECLALTVDTSLPARRVIRELDRLATRRGLPAGLVLDNGPEFTGSALDAWVHARGIRLGFIQPGKPVPNAFVERFNGTLRDECLNAHWFTTLHDARTRIEAWRRDYNTVRPHSSLGDETPEAFAAAINHAGVS